MFNNLQFGSDRAKSVPVEAQTLMRRWMWVVPALLLTGCSKTSSLNPTAEAPGNPPAAAAQADASRDAEAKAEPARSEIVIPKGTQLQVRIDENVDTKRNRAGDQFRASLAEPIVLGGKTVVPKGTPFVGHVIESEASGRMEGRAVLALTLDSFELSGKGYHVKTGSIDRESTSHKKRNVALIGGGAGLGALIGGLAGGGKGALIGAGAGAGAGTAGAAATGKKEVGVAAESLLSFPLKSPVTI
jgi:hypothetical protein